MISIEKLNNYLNSNSNEINNNRDYVFHIPKDKMSEEHIYDKYILDGSYGFLNKDIIDVPEWTGLDKNYQLFITSDIEKKNSFVHSILNQVIAEYRYLDSKSRALMSKDLLRQIAFDMEEKSLYHDNDYTRKRSLIREKFMSNSDIDGDSILKSVIIDYFSMTVYIFKECIGTLVKKRKIERIGYIPGMWKNDDRKNEYILKNPTCFLIETNGRYMPIIKKSMEGVFVSTEINEELLKELDKNPVKKVERSLSTNSKISLTEIQKIAVSMNILLVKKSDKTGKELNKKISELRDEINALNL